MMAKPNNNRRTKVVLVAVSLGLTALLVLAGFEVVKFRAACQNWAISSAFAELIGRRVVLRHERFGIIHIPTTPADWGTHYMGTVFSNHLKAVDPGEYSYKVAEDGGLLRFQVRDRSRVVRFKGIVPRDPMTVAHTGRM